MYKQIVVGTDGSAGANMAVDTAIDLARLTGATLHIVTAHKVTSAFQFAAAAEVSIPVDEIAASNEAVHANAQRVCDQAVERAGRAGVATQVHCVEGDASDALLRVAQDAQCDLLVVGNRGMSGARRLLGSVPKKLSHHCSSSLLIVDTTSARTG